MEAPRGAREPTGTNGPTLNNKHPHHACGCNNKQRTNYCRNHYTNHDQPTPPQPHTMWTPTKQGGNSVEHQSCGGHSTGETPSNIPNLEAKPGSADGTATDRLWESRTPPQHTQTSEGLTKQVRPSQSYTAIRRLKECQAAREGFNTSGHCRTCALSNNAWPALLHSHDPRRLSYRPLPGPLHRRAHADRLCPCG